MGNERSAKSPVKVRLDGPATAPMREARAQARTPAGAPLVAFDFGKVATFAGPHAMPTPAAPPLQHAGDPIKHAAVATFAAPAEDEIEGRLASTAPVGADARAPVVKISPVAVAKLARVQSAAESSPGPSGKGKTDPRAAAAALHSFGRKGTQKAVGASGRGPGGSGPALSGQGPTVDADATPGPGGAFEAMLSEEVSAYLDGNLDPARQEKLGNVTAMLLQGADALGRRTLTDPETAALKALESAAQPGPPKTGYENEPLWLRTLAGVRDVTGQLGGIVGMIGLAATIGGFILAALVPLVGGFLITVGKLCDAAAPILDLVSLVCGAILIKYNHYRLVRETDPKERRRLLDMVRQDAMGVVMSGVSFATAVAPLAGRALGKSRAGRFVGRWASAGRRTIAGRVVRLAGGSSTFSRGLARIGRAGRAGLSGVATLGRRVRGRFHTAMGRFRDYGIQGALSTNRVGRLAVRIGSTRAARGLGGLVMAGAGRLRRGVEWAARTRAGQWAVRGGEWVGQRLAGSRVGRYAQRIYGENLDLARLLHANSARYHHLYVGDRLKRELADIQRGTTLSTAADARTALRNRLPAQQFPEVNVNNLDFRRSRPAATPSGTAATPALTPLEFVRNKSRLKRVLANLKAQEAAEVRALIAANPSITDAALARQLNARSPNPNARWTEDELWAFRQLSPTSTLPKTPHHTISVLDAPHLQYDTRYIQLGNAPLVTASDYERFATLAARRPVTPGGPARTVPFVRTTDEARQFATGAQLFGNPPRPLTGVFPPDYFRSEEFFRELRLRGNTGVFINPNDASQHLLFDAHFVAGHRWQTGETGAQALFGPTVESAERFQGTVGRTLLDQSVKGYVRGSAHYSGGWRDRERDVADAFLMGSGAASSVDMFNPDEPTAAREPGSPLGPEPEAPPSPVPHSPQSLLETQQQREAVLEAIAAVRAHVVAAKKAGADNRVAKEAALALKERSAEQALIAGTERATVAVEQGKLTTAGKAQEEMAAQNKKAANASNQGKQQADGVQSEGKGLSVEAKPENPESRSWLERAWDATGGAAWDKLIAPTIRFVRRKIKEVTESIGGFITRMIDQALGLDEIERELSGGGQDIRDRKQSLGETDTGLDATQKQAGAEQSKNQQSAQQADQNIREAQGAQDDAEGLLGRLLAQNRALQAEEKSGKDYVAAFGARYEPYFKHAPGGTEEAAPLEDHAPPGPKDSGLQSLVAEDGSGLDTSTEPPAVAESTPLPSADAEAEAA